MWAASRVLRSKIGTAVAHAASNLRDNRGRVALLACTTFSAMLSCSSSAQNEQSSSTSDVLIYLKPESKALLQKYLVDQGMHPEKLDTVCILRGATQKEEHVFKPLYGQRAAFRLKGIVQSRDGSVVGCGRVSSMVGEIKEEGYEASLPITVSKTTQVASLRDIPTRLASSAHGQLSSEWKGMLPSTAMRGATYGALRDVTFTPIPVEKQIIVDGYICSSKYANSEGQCTYDRSEDEDEVIAETRRSAADSSSNARRSDAATASTATPSAETGKVTADEGQENDENKPTSEGTEEKGECPICRYMKSGPCKEEFLQWDACVQTAKAETLHTECFYATWGMMQCMRKYEYYDIMVAGTDYGKMEAAVAAAEAEKKAAANAASGSADGTASSSVKHQ